MVESIISDWVTRFDSLKSAYALCVPVQLISQTRDWLSWQIGFNPIILSRRSPWFEEKSSQINDWQTAINRQDIVLFSPSRCSSITAEDFQWKERKAINTRRSLLNPFSISLALFLTLSTIHFTDCKDKTPKQQQTNRREETNRYAWEDIETISKRLR